MRVWIYPTKKEGNGEKRRGRWQPLLCGARRLRNTRHRGRMASLSRAFRSATWFLLPTVGTRRQPVPKKHTGEKKIGEYDTTGSRVITDLSTNGACRCLTSQIGRDVVLSPEYGRTQRSATVAALFVELTLGWGP